MGQPLLRRLIWTGEAAAQRCAGGRGRALPRRNRFTMVAFLPFMLLPGPATGANLLVNGSFDGGTQGWETLPEEPPACAQLAWESPGHVRVVLDCANAAVEVGWRQVVEVSPLAHYRVGFRTRLDALSAEADVKLTFLDSQGSSLWSTGVEALAGTAGWQTINWAFETPADAASVEVLVGVRFAELGEARFDDIEIRKIAAVGPRELAVTFHEVTGEVTPFAQTNRGPVVDLLQHGTFDMTDRLQAVGITTIRTHDVHTAYDTSVIFPDPDADPTLPASYDFTTTDTAITEARAGGFDLLFRLGESYNGPRNLRMPPETWTEVARRIVMHVNHGWAGGTHAGVRYWEIWNEPNVGLFWSGTPEQYYDLYTQAAKAIKQLDPTLKVGGPGMAGFTRVYWIRDMLRAIKAAGAPLDFFSWHVYHMGNPHAMARAQRMVRRVVDEEGFAAAEVFNTEWNLNPGQGCEEVNCGPYVESAYNAAHLTAALTYLQDTDAPFAFRYRTDGTATFGLFGDGITEPLFSRSGLAFLFLAAFADTPERLAATGGDEAGFTILAGRDEQGARVTIVIANQGGAEPGYDLRLIGFPRRFTWRVEEIADTHPCTLATCAPAAIASGDQRDLTDRVLSMPMSAPAVHRVTIDASRKIRRRLRRAP